MSISPGRNALYARVRAKAYRELARRHAEEFRQLHEAEKARAGIQVLVSRSTLAKLQGVGR